MFRVPYKRRGRRNPTTSACKHLWLRRAHREESGCFLSREMLKELAPASQAELERQHSPILNVSGRARLLTLVHRTEIDGKAASLDLAVVRHAQPEIDLLTRRLAGSRHGDAEGPRLHHGPRVELLDLEIL